MTNGSGKATSLVPIKNYAIQKVGMADLQEVLRENVGRALTEFDLTRVKVPTGGMTAWTVPTLDGDKLVQQIDGVIVYHREPRAYWSVPFGESGGNTPPDCSSTFGDVGQGDPGGECASCPYAQYGSKPPAPGQTQSRGQACKQMKLVFLLPPDSLLPMALFLPPTSIAPTRRYLLGLASEAQHYASVLTRITLEKDKNADGIEFAKVRYQRAAVLDGSEEAKMREYSQSIRAALDTVVIEQTDLPEG